jgi:hypothetical protein
MVHEQSAAEVDRVPTRRVRQLVEEGLRRKGGVGVADRAPPQDRHPDLGRVQLHAEARDVVGEIDRPLN